MARIGVPKPKSLAERAANELLKLQPVFAPAMEHPEAVAPLPEILDDFPGWHWVEDDHVHSADPPAQESLEKIAAPTLVIYGDRESARMRENAATLQRRIPNARTVALPGVGHLGNIEVPGLFNETVLGFLSDV